MDKRIQDLSNVAAAEILISISAEWTETNGIAALTIYDQLRRDQFIGKSLFEYPTENSSGVYSEFIKRSIDALLTSNTGLSKLTETALENYYNVGHSQSSDFGRLALVGLISIGLVLAARVKQVGDVTFYQGVPPEIVKIIESIKPAGFDVKK